MSKKKHRRSHAADHGRRTGSSDHSVSSNDPTSTIPVAGDGTIMPLQVAAVPVGRGEEVVPLDQSPSVPVVQPPALLMAQSSMERGADFAAVDSSGDHSPPQVAAQPSQVVTSTQLVTSPKSLLGDVISSPSPFSNPSPTRPPYPEEQKKEIEEVEGTKSYTTPSTPPQPGDDDDDGGIYGIGGGGGGEGRSKVLIGREGSMLIYAEEDDDAAAAEEDVDVARGAWPQYALNDPTVTSPDLQLQQHQEETFVMLDPRDVELPPPVPSSTSSRRGVESDHTQKGMHLSPSCVFMDEDEVVVEVADDDVETEVYLDEAEEEEDQEMERSPGGDDANVGEILPTTSSPTIGYSDSDYYLSPRSGHTRLRQRRLRLEAEAAAAAAAGQDPSVVASGEFTNLQILHPSDSKRNHPGHQRQRSVGFAPSTKGGLETVSVKTKTKKDKQRESVLTPDPFKNDARAIISSAGQGAVIVITERTNSDGTHSFDVTDCTVTVRDVIQFRWFSEMAILECDKNFVPLPGFTPHLRAQGHSRTYSAAAREDEAEAAAREAAEAAQAELEAAMSSACRRAIVLSDRSHDGLTSASASVTAMPSGSATVTPLSAITPLAHNSPCTRGGKHTIILASEGTYYFRSSRKDNQELRVVINVIGEQSKFIRNSMKYVAAGFTFLAAVTTVIIIAAFVVNTNVLILPDSSGGDPEAYQGTREIQTLLFEYLFPWYVLGLVLFLALTLARIVHCCWTSMMSDFGRGFTDRQQKLAQGTEFAIAIILFSLVMCCWGLILDANTGWSAFFRAVTQSTTDSLNEVIALTADLDFIHLEIPILFPNIRKLPSDPKLLSQVRQVAEDIQGYASAGEDLIQGIFRATTIASFCAIQIVVVGCSCGLVAVVRRSYRLMLTAVWWMCVSIAVLCFAIGTTWLFLKVVERSAVVIDEFQDKTLTSAKLRRATGSSEDAPLVKLFGVCLDEDKYDVEFIHDATVGMVDDWNTLAIEKGYPEFGLPRSNITTGSSSSNTSMTGNQTSIVYSNQTVLINISQLTEYTDYLAFQLDVLDMKLKNDPDALAILAPEFNSRTAPTLRRAISVVRTLLGMIDCQLIRTAIGAALPKLKNGVIDNLQLLIVFLLITFAFHALFIFCGWSASYIFARVFKTWFDVRSRRWFRFRTAYQAHRRLLDTMSSEEAAMPIPWERRTSIFDILSAFHHLNMANSLVVCLQAVLLVIFHQSHEDNRLGQNFQVVCFFCVVVPWVTLPTEKLRNMWSRAWCRFTVFAVCAVACTMATLQVKESWIASRDCFQENNRYRSELPKNTTSTLVFGEHCGVGEVVEHLQIVVYAFVIGFVCLICGLTALVLLSTVHVHHNWGAKLRTRRKDHRTAEEKERFARWAFIGITVSLVVLLAGIALIVIVQVIPTRKEPSATNKKLTITAKGCNGDDRYCDRRLDDLVWLTTHNAMSSFSDGFFAPNHFYGTHAQMENGIRSFMLDVFLRSGTTSDPALAGNDTSSSISGAGGISGSGSGSASSSSSFANGTSSSNTTSPLSLATVDDVLLCHGSCGLGSYPLLRDLVRMRKFIEANKSTFFIIIFEQSELVSHDILADVFEAANVTQWVWNPTANSTTTATSLQIGDPMTNTSFVWPTLQELIDEDMHFMVFTDIRVPLWTYGGSRNQPAPTWLLSLFDFMFETPFLVTSAKDFECDLNRGNSSDSNLLSRKLSILNHFLSLPAGAPNLAAQANTADNVQSHYKACLAAWRKRPNFITVDFWTVGNVLQTATLLNFL